METLSFSDHSDVLLDVLCISKTIGVTAGVGSSVHGYIWCHLVTTDEACVFNSFAFHLTPVTQFVSEAFVVYINMTQEKVLSIMLYFLHFF